MVALWIAIGLVVGLGCGALVMYMIIKRHLKKHPPINEKTLRDLMLALGIKPSEGRIRAILKKIK